MRIRSNSYRSPIYEIFDPPPAAADFRSFVGEKLPILERSWLDRYRALSGESEVSEIHLGGFAYLFDHFAERVIVAHGVTTGETALPRDRSRQQGYPLGNAANDDRGHLFAHSAGGGLEINLFPQRATLNRGAFRRLEKMCVVFPGSFYFVALLYEGASQRPTCIEQGILVDDPHAPRFELETFEN